MKIFVGTAVCLAACMLMRGTSGGLLTDFPIMGLDMASNFIKSFNHGNREVLKPLLHSATSTVPAPALEAAVSTAPAPAAEAAEFSVHEGSEGMPFNHGTQEVLKPLLHSATSTAPAPAVDAAVFTAPAPATEAAEFSAHEGSEGKPIAARALVPIGSLDVAGKSNLCHKIFNLLFQALEYMAFIYPNARALLQRLVCG